MRRGTRIRRAVSIRALYTLYKHFAKTSNGILDRMIIGTTFSHRHAKWLELSVEQTFKDILSLRFDVIRLGLYWDEIEKEKRVYDFTSITSLLDLCQKHNQKVILTIGMKAPRWPEYYLPQWISSQSEAEEQVFSFIQESINKLSSYSCITHWQVENEPLDPSGPQRMSIRYEVLKEEVTLVRSLDSRPIVINVWGNLLTFRNSFARAKELADVVGVNLYYKTPFWKYFYVGPWNRARTLKQQILTCPKPVWITELQAEPWERKGKDFRADNPETISVSLLKQYIAKAYRLDAEGIFLWGSEYWVYRKQKKDMRIWNCVQEILTQNKAQDLLSHLPTQ